MKKLLFAFLLLLTLLSNAQTFQIHVPFETLSVGFNDEAVFPVHIINVSDEEISVYIKRTENSIPADWSSSLCFTYCFSPGVDSIATTRDFGSGPIPAGDSVEVSLHVFTGAASDSGNVALKIGSLANSSEYATIVFSTYSFALDIENEAENVADKFVLEQNYPNPFNPTTTIKYSIPKLNGVEAHGRASLRIYNILGEEIATLVNQKQAPGNYTVQFDASDLPSGVYFSTLRVGDFVATKKMMLTK